jgi:7-cyano-7-deazaguanine synthase
LSRDSTAVALLSGGLDSVVATTAACRDDGRVALALTFDYGQRSAERELEAARAAAGELDIEWKAVELPWMTELLPPSLARGGAGPPRVVQGDLDSGDGAATRAEAVWIPNRNGVLLNAAASFAEALGAGAVVVGFNREEAATFPDNSRGYLERATAALELSTLARVRVVSPTVGMTKPEIVRLGLELGAPLVHVWSCYDGGERMCGLCESCARLVRALRSVAAPPEKWPKALAGSR